MMFEGFDEEERKLMNSIYFNELVYMDKDDEDYEELVEMLVDDIEGMDFTDALVVCYIWLMKNGNDITLEDLEYGKYDFYEYGNIIKWGNEEYVVVQETLMDVLFREYMEEYIDECVIGDIPESLRGYFDYEAYIDDWENDDGYSVMASYDGYIDDIDILGDQYYVFRIN